MNARTMSMGQNLTAEAGPDDGGGYIVFQEIRQVFPRTPGSAGRRAKAVEPGTTAANTALENVDLDIPRGQFVAIVGASGCGKTTLLNMLAGLVRPTSGTVTIDGSGPRMPNPSVGYMFARDALMPWRTARKNIELPLEAAGWGRAARRQRAEEMMELVGLRGKGSLYPLQLSQGMRQRVALARTLAADPELLLMDEPFAALDARTKLTMQAEFLRIWERGSGSQSPAAAEPSPKTVVFVTHDLSEAALLADRVVVMLPSPGRIAVDKTIGLPRPRADQLGEIMFTDEFKSASKELFERLEGAFTPAAMSTGAE